MQGGKLLGTGSSSCVFSPNIPCKNSDKILDSRVSKLLYHYDSKNLSNYEKKQAELIKKIKGYKEWAVIYDEYCDAPSPEVVKNLDEEGYNDCFKNYSIDSDPPYDEAKLLNSDNGGRTLRDLFNEMFSGNLTMGIITKNFKFLMGMFIPLFKGLKEMDKHKIVHNDIKSINITGDFNKLKYIDFGLTAKASNLEHFIDRSKTEGNTKRLYYHYPLEYIYFYTEPDKLQSELQLLNIKYRRNYNILLSIYKMLGYDLDKSCNHLYNSISNSEYTIEDIIKKIDVYGLGIQVPLLFFDLGFDSEPVGPPGGVIDDFFVLFKLMVDPDLNTRLTAKESYDIFMELIKKHNITAGNKKMKITRKVTQRRKATAKARKATPRRKATARRATPRRKATARRATARRVTPRRRATTRRAIARRATARRATARRATARRATPRRRATARRATARRATVRRATARRATPRRRATTRRRATQRKR